MSNPVIRQYGKVTHNAESPALSTSAVSETLRRYLVREHGTADRRSVFDTAT